MQRSLHECHKADSKTFSDADMLQLDNSSAMTNRPCSVIRWHHDTSTRHGRVGLQRSLPVLLGFGLPVQRRGAWGDKDPVVDAITGGEVEFTEVGEVEESPHASRVEHAFRRSKLRGESENQFCEHVAAKKTSRENKKGGLFVWKSF